MDLVPKKSVLLSHKNYLPLVTFLPICLFLAVCFSPGIFCPWHVSDQARLVPRVALKEVLVSPCTFSSYILQTLIQCAHTYSKKISVTYWHYSPSGKGGNCWLVTLPLEVPGSMLQGICSRTKPRGTLWCRSSRYWVVFFGSLSQL